MRLNVQAIIVFCALSIACIFPVHSQNEAKMDYDQSYNLENSILKSMDYIATSENFELLSEEDIKLLKRLPNFELPIPLGKMLRDVLAESAISKCGRDLDYVFENLLGGGLWKMKMLDSFGKPESGILLGNFNWLGEYDECLEVYAPAKDVEGNITVGDFHGKYCTLRSSLKFGKLSLNLALAVCLPDTCDAKGTSENNATTVLHTGGSLGLLGSLFGNTTITCQSTSTKITAGAVIVALILSIIIFLAAIGSSITVFEYYMKVDNSSAESVDELPTDVELTTPGNAKNIANGDSYNDAVKSNSLPDWLDKVKPFFNCFCIFTNGEKLLNTDSSEGQLPCLHGIRFFSMTWIIMCHNYMSVVVLIKNVLDFPKFIDHWIFQIVLNGFFSVDSFFLLSGFLVAYLFFKQAQKTDGKIPWLYFYVHRYVRLTPVYLLVLLFLMYIYPYMGSGPLWSDNISRFCLKNWWWNLLYINNFTPQQEQCMAWSWYLANDMQFYIISPLFLITLWRWPKIGYSVLGVFLSIPIIISFVLTLQYDLFAGLSSLIENTMNMEIIQTKINDYFDKIYYKPYARIGPYLVGISLAYVLHRRKKMNADKLNRIYLTVGWILASGLTLTCQFGLYQQNLNKVGAAFYNAFSRVIFGLGLAWVIFVCVEGQADTVNRFLSWKPWIPMSRLTFGAYLIHPIVQLTYFTSMKSMLYFTHTSMFMLYLGFLIITYVAALIVTLLFESPVIRLEKFVRNVFASK